MINDNSEKSGTLYKFLSIIYLNPDVRIYDPPLNRYPVCFTYRKEGIHKNGYNILHPPNSYEMSCGLSQYEVIHIFNQFEVFISYDPLTFLSIMAPICGCASVVYPIDGFDELEWIKTTAAKEYCEKNNITKLYGVSYGLDNLEWAKSTIHLAKKQWEDMIEYYKNNHLKSFIDDINNFDAMENTIGNVYYK
jgi:hypothetical protein